jgi:hypothetical protein
MKPICLFIATPMYGGVGHIGYIASILKLTELLRNNGILFKLRMLPSESLITRGRNKLSHMFLQDKDATHLLFIDADIAFQAEDILYILNLNKDLIGLPYAIKDIKWDQIGKTLLQGNYHPDELKKASQHIVFNVHKKEDLTRISNGLLNAKEIGTGLMLIKRDVLYKIMEAEPELYSIDYSIPECPKVYHFFDTLIDDDKRFLSEDYAFCKRWKKIGGDVFLYVPVKTIHFGNHPFEYNYSEELFESQK